MKEMPLNKAFADAMHKIGDDRDMKHAAKQLEIMQQAVADFHEAGIPVTLTVRADKNGLRHDHADGRILANGEIEAGDVRLDFAIQIARFRDDKMEFFVWLNGRKVIEREWEFEEDSWKAPQPEDADENWDPWDKRKKAKEAQKDLKSQLSGLIIDLKAKCDFVARYNVGPNGIAGTAIEKPLSVAPPLKLKKPEAP